MEAASRGPPGMRLEWAAVGLGLLLLGQAPPRKDVERGRYLVHHVAMCVQCHTPRDARGKLLELRLLQGAPVPVSSPFPEDWAFRAPWLAGLPGRSEDDLVHLLRTGIVPRTGRPPDPPMPPFRMTEEDARAVAAYLKSLP